MERTIFTALTVRILIALCTKTFFQPDEYFQALEPAHHFVFGYGRLTWEWVAPHPIRSFLYPALNVPIYWLLKVLNMDWDYLLVGEWDYSDMRSFELIYFIRSQVLKSCMELLRLLRMCGFVDLLVRF
jgi:hypothetical protein